MISLLPRRKYQCILQSSEEDCGAACLAAVSKYYGNFISINRSREAVGTGQFGTTLLGLKRGAEIVGFNTRAVKASPAVLDKLKEIVLPTIIHWKGTHWVILYGKSGDKYAIGDPAVGLRYLKRRELEAAWNGVMLLLEPDADFSNKSSDEDTSKEGFGRFFKRVWRFRTLLFQILVANLILGLLSLTSPILIQILTDDVLVRQDTNLLTIVATAVVIMSIFASSLQLIQSIIIAHFTQRLQLGLVLEFGYKLLHLPLNYYESRRSGEIISRLRDINEINQLVAQVVASLPSQFFITIISYGFMVFYSWKLTVVATIISLIMAASTLPFLPALRQKTRNLLVLSAENQGVLVETFKGALVLKATNAAPQFWEELQSRFGRLANLTFATIHIGIINSTLTKLTSKLGGTTLLVLGSLLVIQRELSIGQLLAFNAMQANVLAFISLIMSLADEYFRSKTAVSRLLEVIDATPEAVADSQKPVVKLPHSEDIYCNNLCFHHTGRTSLLEDFTIKLPGGKSMAFIGKSGCGKSSLAKLIAGLYQPQSGNICVGMYSLQDLSLSCLREQIVLVPQEPHFWSRSILENFRLGNPYASFEQVITACKIAEADEFIAQLPNTYQTILGEFGANLSGGQRQRLAIARAIVNNPPILILDEATSGLDPIGESRVLKNILSHRQGKTTIIITHRPSAINRVDWVVMLDKGRVEQHGSLESLRLIPGKHQEFLSGFATQI